MMDSTEYSEKKSQTFKEKIEKLEESKNSLLRTTHEESMKIAKLVQIIEQIQICHDKLYSIDNLKQRYDKIAHEIEPRMLAISEFDKKATNEDNPEEEKVHEISAENISPLSQSIDQLTEDMINKRNQRSFFNAKLISDLQNLTHKYEHILGKPILDFSENVSTSAKQMEVQTINLQDPVLLYPSGESISFCYLNEKSGNEILVEMPIPKYSHSILVKNLLYTGGGLDESSGATSNFYKIELEKDATKLIELTGMRIARESHTFLEIPGEKIAALGGCDGSIFLEDCEYYDILENKWEDLPELTEPRKYIAACYHDSRIYAFGGVFDRMGLNTIEYLTFPGTSSEWVSIVLSEKIFPPNYYFIALPQTKGVILFGGVNWKNEIYKFYPKKETIKKKKINLGNPTCFRYSNSVIKDGSWYGLTSAKKIFKINLKNFKSSIENVFDVEEPEQVTQYIVRPTNKKKGDFQIQPETLYHYYQRSNNIVILRM